MEEKDEEDDWNSSRIKGFSFGDDDEDFSYDHLESYRSIGSAQDEYCISFDTPQETPVSDRIKAASHRIQQRLSSPHLKISEVVSHRVNSDDSYNHNYLQRQLEKVYNSIYEPLHPKETIRNIFWGKAYSLEFYTSYEDKMNLLDEALELGDGNGILAITLFLRKTLKTSKFIELLSRRRIASRVYIDYLESSGQVDELLSFHYGLEDSNSAFNVSLTRAFDASKIIDKISRLKTLLSSSPPLSNEHEALTKESILLLEKISSLGDFPTSSSNTPITVLSLLHHSCSHHWTSSHPELIRSTHKLSSKQFLWTACLARAHSGAWSDLETLLLEKSWFGKQKSLLLDSKLLLSTLVSHSAPTSVLATYLPFISSFQDRLAFALKNRVDSIVIDSFSSSKDRQSLLSYRDSCTPRSPEWFLVNSALSSPSIRWKN